ncbi:MAG: hypothetical protein V4515_12280 [Chloroflexota bacterium]
MTISGSHTMTAERPATWYRAPVSGLAHAFRGVRALCGISYWAASWGIVGPIEAVDRGQACGSCLILTGSTEAELRGQNGDR